MAQARCPPGGPALTVPSPRAPQLPPGSPRTLVPEHRRAKGRKGGSQPDTATRASPDRPPPTCTPRPRAAPAPADSANQKQMFLSYYEKTCPLWKM